jgi:iron complex outermembrane receptor protein
MATALLSSATRRTAGVLRCALLAGSALACTPALAHAQAQSQAATLGTAASVSVVDEVVVTARRRDEDAQTVPISLNAFNAETLESRRAYNVRDLQAYAPSLVVTVTNPRNTSINIRGLGNNVSVYNDGLQPAVGVYLDQVFLGRPGQTVFDLHDLEGVEVLRGPQGTLFGKDTSAGAVVIRTKAPSFERELSGDVSLGDYDYYQAHVVAGGALFADKLAGRLSVGTTQRGGFVDNVYAGTKTQDYRDWSVRGQLLFTPNDDLTLRLVADYGQQRSSTAATVLSGVLTNYTDGTPYPFGYYQRVARVGQTPLPIDPEARRVSIDGPNSYWEESGGVNAILDYTLPWAVLTSVTSYRTWNWSPHNDADGTAASAAIDFHQANQQKQFSQEIRLTSTGDRAIDYVAGAYFFWQTIEAEALNAYGPQAANWFLAPAAAPAATAAAALNNYTVISHSSPETTSAAVFAEGVWHANDRLDVTLGLRYTWERMTGYFRQTASGQSLAGLAADQQALARSLRARFGVANSFEAEAEDGSVTGRLSLAYKVSDDILAYATYARGYKAGGLNLSNINTIGFTAVDPVIDPETIDALEAGLKTSWLDKKLTANLAVFWTEDRNYQTTQVNLINSVSSLTNAGEVRSAGVEADIQARPTEDLSLYASAAYTDAKYTSYKAAPCAIEIRTTSTCDLSGQRLPGPPRWSASAGGEYSRPVSDALRAYVGADYSYRSDVFTTAANSIYSRIPAYGVLNLRAGVRADDGRWEVQVWGRNVTDEVYWLSLSAANTGAISGTLGDPSTWGVTLKARY